MIKTTNLGLTQFESSDVPNWLVHYNNDMKLLDTFAGQQTADSAQKDLTMDAINTTLENHKNSIEENRVDIAEYKDNKVLETVQAHTEQIGTLETVNESHDKEIDAIKDIIEPFRTSGIVGAKYFIAGKSTLNNPCVYTKNDGVINFNAHVKPVLSFGTVKGSAISFQNNAFYWNGNTEEVETGDLLAFGYLEDGTIVPLEVSFSTSRVNAIMYSVSVTISTDANCVLIVLNGSYTIKTKDTTERE